MEPFFQAAAKTAAADAANWPRLFHVFGVVAYVGGLLAVSRMLALISKGDPGVGLPPGAQQVPGGPAAEQRTAAAALARRVYLTVPIPGLVVLLLAGLHSVFADPLKKDYFHQPWFLMKLTLVLVLMTVDHLLVLRPLKTLARGEGDPAANAALYRSAFWVVGLLVFALLMTLYVFRYL